MMRLSNNQTINTVAKSLVKSGWSLRTAGKHRVITDPETGYSYPIPISPSCGRAEKNWLAGIRKIQRGVRP